MSELWPHLPAAVGAVVYADLVAGGEPVARESHPDQTWSPIGGRVSGKQVRELIDAVSRLAEKYEYPEPAGRDARVAFDRDAAALVRHHLSLSWAEAGNRNLWSFLSLVALPHVTKWRFGLKNVERWIATDLTRHTWARLWWQAVVFAGHEHVLAALSESDLNALLERRSLGGDPRLVRETARAVTTLAAEPLRRAVIRDVTLRLNRHLAFLDVRAQSDEQVRELCTRLTAETLTRLGAGVQSDLRAVGSAAVRPRTPDPSAIGPAHGANARLRSLELCAGAGGSALGLEQAGFDPVMLIDNRAVACETLRLNRPHWDVRDVDLLDFAPAEYGYARGVDLLSAGLPRVQASATVNRTRGSDLELQLFEATVKMTGVVEPRALLIENMPDLVTKPDYAPIRTFVEEELSPLGYRCKWLVVNASDFGVPQDRRQGVLVALAGDAIDRFELHPDPSLPVQTVGSVLKDSMAAAGWPQAEEWAAQAQEFAPTLVGGSWERGGPDLGPTGSKNAWARIGVDGATVADEPPGPDFLWDRHLGRPGLIKLTVEQVALLQGFPPDWRIAGLKTARYRQIGHASPPPVARALGLAIRAALGEG
ncbi:DNA cytosine methyltransferase [Catellatospora citrea]|uniref:DNA (cytosine-5-)-methyltransferase n=1 Tax=Catellatospora citrea TaxID=53366 RepID=A0A8J3K4I9_9ACTN|nr:DNA cytosine methyltransferase [Catellatospora citrea]RKE11129.1 site-specific DNA-cytosine methylase [Catellatospora citrea]GIF96591.1 hypothetical protein Cci01nite_16850 [Catellatospora citrea]